MQSSECGMAIVLMKSQQVWLPAQEPHKIKPVMNRRGTHEVTPLAEELLAIGNSWCRGFFFGGGVWPLIGCQALVKDLTPMPTQ